MKSEAILQSIFGKDCLDVSDSLSIGKSKEDNATYSRYLIQNLN